MPYSISLENDVLRIRLTGRLTALELTECCVEVKNCGRPTTVPHCVADLTGVTEVAIHYPEISDLAERCRRLRFPNPIKSAIVTSNQQHLGYARMFQTLNENPLIAIRIFPDEPSANRWIAGADN